ncbi:hypothetical protein [Sorangium sp. So ce1097]|uniref:hypothetical protein n=1 Tax=Sorangium sp. So ce1097 TaxID=3133330 RepID=UPI003F642D99
MTRRIAQLWRGVVPSGVAGALFALAGCADLGPRSRGADAEEPETAEGRGEALGEGSAEATATGGCLVTGCAGQICAAQRVTTTCEWRDAYACYRSHGTCERDARGQCGWRPTPELAACLRAAREP